MRRLTLLKIIIISIAGSSLLCLLAFLSLRSVNDLTGFPHRQELAIRIAKEFETLSVPEAIKTYIQRHAQSQASGRTKIWVVDEQGELLGATTADSLPFSWEAQDKPIALHDITIRHSFLPTSPEFTFIRLDSPDKKYLIIYLAPRRDSHIFWGTSFLFIFITVTLAVFLALTMNFFYLQRKSKEAKKVLGEIELGNLEARFKIKQFDEIGSLMLDFNRMADNLQKLILRVHEVERSRRNLLQELGHDVRTPLTTLKTSLETLRQNFSKMSELDREEFFNLIEAEFNYLMSLLEDLFFIADLDEPHFKTSLKKVDLLEILNNEIRNRQQQSIVNWQIIPPQVEPIYVLGDAYLILRLFKNAFDNAGRFANTKVKLHFVSSHDFWEVLIDDDGQGLSYQSLEEFGHRRQSRIHSIAKGSHLSLGLGSVIMKSIAELHNGSIEIQNLIEGGQIIGARQKIRLHK